MKTKFLVLIVMLVAFVSFSTGFLLKENISNSITPIFDYQKDHISEIDHLDFDLKSIIHITSESDVSSKRNSLIKFLWKDSDLPPHLPNKIDFNITDERFSKISNLKNIDKLEFAMEYGFNSIAYMFHPENSNNRLIIYHHGHGGDFDQGKKTIEYFINKKYTVLAFTMPLQGQNNKPTIDHEKFGKIIYVSHNQFVFLESEDFTPLKLFFEPVIISLNYVDENYHFDSKDMIGISGGGWTTVLISAIDPRIQHSFSIAGSYPLFLRDEVSDIGDYEQINPALYEKVNYLELYILASTGESRKHSQIFIKNDPCCFGGNEYMFYEEYLMNTIDDLGGKYEIIIDKTTIKHEISEYVLEKISNSLS